MVLMVGVIMTGLEFNQFFASLYKKYIERGRVHIIRIVNATFQPSLALFLLSLKGENKRIPISQTKATILVSWA